MMYETATFQPTLNWEFFFIEITNDSDTSLNPVINQGFSGFTPFFSFSELKLYMTFGYEKEERRKTQLVNDD